MVWETVIFGTRVPMFSRTYRLSCLLPNV